MRRGDGGGLEYVEPVTYEVLVVGFDPAAVPGVDPAQSAPAFAEAERQAAEHEVTLVSCLVAPDESAVAQIAEAIGSRTWHCVVIGGGIRKPEAISFRTVLLEVG